VSRYFALWTITAMIATAAIANALPAVHAIALKTGFGPYAPHAQVIAAIKTMAMMSTAYRQDAGVHDTGCVERSVSLELPECRSDSAIDVTRIAVPTAFSRGVSVEQLVIATRAIVRKAVRIGNSLFAQYTRSASATL
jgi:hypothetical protein